MAWARWLLIIGAGGASVCGDGAPVCNRFATGFLGIRSAGLQPACSRLAFPLASIGSVLCESGADLPLGRRKAGCKPALRGSER